MVGGEGSILHRELPGGHSLQTFSWRPQKVTDGGLEESRRKLTRAIKAGCYGIQEGVLGSQEAPHHRHFRTCSRASPSFSGGKPDPKVSEAGRATSACPSRRRSGETSEEAAAGGSQVLPAPIPGARLCPDGRTREPRAEGKARGSGSRRKKSLNSSDERPFAPRPGGVEQGLARPGAKSDGSGSALGALQEGSPARRPQQGPSESPPRPPAA